MSKLNYEALTPRPIEEAPKDGTAVMGCAKRGGVWTVPMHCAWVQEKETFMMCFEQETSGLQVAAPAYPTHFIPLEAIEQLFKGVK